MACMGDIWTAYTLYPVFSTASGTRSNPTYMNTTVSQIRSATNMMKNSNSVAVRIPMGPFTTAGLLKNALTLLPLLTFCTTSLLVRFCCKCR